MSTVHLTDIPVGLVHGSVAGRQNFVRSDHSSRKTLDAAATSSTIAAFVSVPPVTGCPCTRGAAPGARRDRRRQRRPARMQRQQPRQGERAGRRHDRPRSGPYRRRRAMFGGTVQILCLPRTWIGLRNGRGFANTNPYGPKKEYSSLSSTQSTSSTVPRIAPSGESWQASHVAESSSMAASFHQSSSCFLTECIAMRPRTGVLHVRFSTRFRPLMMAHAQG